MARNRGSPANSGVVSVNVRVPGCQDQGGGGVRAGVKIRIGFSGRAGYEAGVPAVAGSAFASRRPYPTEPNQTMKPVLSLTAAALFFATGFVSAKEYREFGKADGTASFQAALVDVQIKAGKYVAMLERADTKKVLAVPADLLREEDQKFIKEEGQRLTLAKGLQVSIVAAREKPATELPKGRRVTKTPEGFAVRIRNGSEFAAEGVTAKYQIVWRQDVRVNANSSRREEHRETGSLDLDNLAPKKEFTGKTESVTLSSDRPNPG